MKKLATIAILMTIAFGSLGASAQQTPGESPTPPGAVNDEPRPQSCYWDDSLKLNICR